MAPESASNRGPDPTQVDGPKESELAPGVEPRVIPSDELMRGARTVLIEHSGEHYRLLVTKNGKLLLQK